MQATLGNWALGPTIKTAVAVVPWGCVRGPEAARFEVAVHAQVPTPRRGRPVAGA